MVEKIIVSRDEVLRYPWLDHTWVYVYYPDTEVTRDPTFEELLGMLLRQGIKQMRGERFDDVTVSGGHAFIKYDDNDIIDYLIGASSWFLNGSLVPKDPSSPKGEFYLKNKEVFYSFFGKLKTMLEERDYKYYYQSIDGME